MNGSLKIKDAGGSIAVQKEAPVIIVIMVLKKGTAVEKMVMVVMVIVQSMHWMLFPIPLEHIIHALVVKQVSTLKNSKTCKSPSPFQQINSVDRVCIKITSNMDDDLCSGGGNKAENWLGGDINLNLNGETIATTSHGFLDFEHCVEASIVDELQLQATSTDGVCITSLSVNNKQLLVGKNGDLPSFWMSTNRLKCTGQRMTTSEITIKDGKIISSECPTVDDTDDDSEEEEKPILVWYGESEIATLTNNAGEWPPGAGYTFVIGNMFDNDPSTFWHSGKDKAHAPKSIVIDFKEPMQFQELTIRRRGQFNDRYENVCLVLNDDTDNELCTDAKTGFSGAEDLLPFITWRKPTDNVKKVELVFRTEDIYYGHAQIADLKIQYKTIDPLESCIDYRSDVACSGELIRRKSIPLTTDEDATLQTDEGYGRCASWCIGTPGAISFNWSVRGSEGYCGCYRNVFVELIESITLTVKL